MTRPVPLLLVLIALAIPLSLLAGRVWLDPGVTPNAALILGELRLPRAVLAVVIGGGLGAAGAAMQGYLRNPLADPPRVILAAGSERAQAHPALRSLDAPVGRLDSALLYCGGPTIPRLARRLAEVRDSL